MRDEVQNEIADMTPEQRGHLIQRIKGYDWTEERKEFVIKFVMLLGLIGQSFPANRQRRKPN
jgi:hypothetical protein